MDKDELYDLLDSRDIDPETFEGWLDNYHKSLGEATEEDMDSYEDEIVGVMSAEEYAQELAEGDYAIPDWIASYIDYAAMADDMRYDGYFEINGTLFRSL